MEIFFQLIGIAILLVVSYTIIKSNISFAPWVPTFAKDLARIFDYLGEPADRSFLDLGSGNGRLTMAAARRGFRAQGVELSLPLFVISWLRHIINPDLKLKFWHGNLFDYDLAESDVIYLFGVPKTLTVSFGVKLISEAKPGAIIISYCFQIAGLKTTAILKDNAKDLPIYIYNT